MHRLGTEIRSPLLRTRVRWSALSEGDTILMRAMSQHRTTVLASPTLHPNASSQTQRLQRFTNSNPHAHATAPSHPAKAVRESDNASANSSLSNTHSRFPATAQEAADVAHATRRHPAKATIRSRDRLDRTNRNRGASQNGSSMSVSTEERGKTARSPLPLVFKLFIPNYTVLAVCASICSKAMLLLNSRE